jgi:hypothetical protein
MERFDVNQMVNLFEQSSQIFIMAYYEFLHQIYCIFETLSSHLSNTMAA